MFHAHGSQPVQGIGCRDPVVAEIFAGTAGRYDALARVKGLIHARDIVAVEQVVAKNPNAIGYVGLGYLAPSIKGLHIGKVAASAETALSKEWPLSRELYVFTNGEPAGASGALIKYILDPAKGQKAVKEVGFVPLAKK